jgi:hypothetical protein
MSLKAAFEFFNGDACPSGLSGNRKYVLIPAIMLALSCQPGLALANPVSGDRLSSFEEKLFMHAYPDESDQSRIDRLEMTVFGQSMTGSQGARMDRLAQALAGKGDGLALAPATDVPAPPATEVPATDGATQPAAEAPTTEAPVPFADQRSAAASERPDYAGGGANAQDVEPTATLPESDRVPTARGEDAGGRQGQSGVAEQNQPAGGLDRNLSDTASGGAPEAQAPSGGPAGRALAREGDASGSIDTMPPTAPDIVPRAPTEIAVAPSFTAFRSNADDYPPTAPDRFANTQAGDARGQQPSGNAVAEPDNKFRERLGVLELQIFGMTFVEDNASERLTRLEAEVFAGAPSPIDSSLQSRLARLMADPGVRARAQRADSAITH